MTRMWLILGLVVGLAAPAVAKKPKRHHKAAPPATAPKGEPDRAAAPPKVDNQSDYQKAKAQLDDLKTSRELPLVSLDNQADDREVPKR